MTGTARQRLQEQTFWSTPSFPGWVTGQAGLWATCPSKPNEL